VKILAVDTALGACSAAVLEGDRVLAHRFAVDGARPRRSAGADGRRGDARSRLVAFAALDRLAVTTGPGTFTGQRVGLAFMRGLRVALGKPLVGVTSLGGHGRTGARQLLALPGTFAFLADGECGGFVLVRTAGGEAEILTLAVAPAARRRGIGSALISAACRHAQEMGAAAMFLEVSRTNEPAKALYTRLGFREVGLRKGLLRRSPAGVMKMLLSAVQTSVTPGGKRRATRDKVAFTWQGN
jgi:ribosomal protein S18 acetylase RimI-like enzyme